MKTKNKRPEGKKIKFKAKCPNNKEINPANVWINGNGKITFSGDWNIFEKHPELTSKNVVITQIK